MMCREWLSGGNKNIRTSLRTFAVFFFPRPRTVPVVLVPKLPLFVAVLEGIGRCRDLSDWFFGEEE